MTFRRLPLGQSRITWLYYDPNTLNLKSNLNLKTHTILIEARRLERLLASIKI